MDPTGQRTQLAARQNTLYLLVYMTELMASGNVQLNQADIVMAGDNLGAVTAGQHPLNAG